MSIDYNGKRGAGFASWLSHNLSDMEFELLLRYRIKHAFMDAHEANTNLSTIHNSCRFQFYWNDKSEWRVSIGTNYRDVVSVDGDVLNRTVRDAEETYSRRSENSISKLLAYDAEVTETFEELMNDDNIPE